MTRLWVNFIHKKKGDFLCAIVLPSARIRGISSWTKFYINFYDIREKGRIHEQVRIYSGFGACIIGDGSPEENTKLEKALNPRAQDKERWAGMCLGSNKKKLVLLSASIFVGVAIFLKRRNLFSKLIK